MNRPTTSSTRRTLLASSIAGAAALALRTTAAQSGTPETGDGIELLFVQAASTGTLTLSDQGYTLTFQHGAGQTVYFSDRPDRITGLLSTADLVSQWPFADESPPNAALAISTATDMSAQVLIGVLSNPTWDAGSATLSYEFLLLADDIPAGSPISVPNSFDSATLFIDGSGPIIIGNLTGPSIEIGIWKMPPR